MFRVVHSTSPDLLRATNPHLTVEAEYGAVVVEGSEYTAAHHQPKGSPYAGDHVVEGGRPAPCNDEGIPTLDPNEGDWTVGVSHLDLDTIGGVLRALPDMADLFAGNDGFWRLAAFVDVNGAHKVALAGASDEDVARLYGWWAYFKTLPRLPFNALNDCTDMVLGCGPVLREILAGNDARIEAGRVFRAAEAALNAASFVEHRASGVLVRKSPTQGDFVNHLYTSPSGVVARAVVALNPEVGSVTVSLESPVAGVSCREVVQGLWGALAGGHAGIAGSPRGERMTETHLADCVAALEAALARG
jgi:hypothetical protein